MITKVLRRRGDVARPFLSSSGIQNGTIKARLLGNKVQKRLKSKKMMVYCSLVLLVAYATMSNFTMTEQQKRILLERSYRMRELITLDKGGGACDIQSPYDDAPNTPGVNTTRTLLTSYPGSGKRFSWTLIKALTNYEVADDWNFSGKLRKNPLTVKTSWPHREGTWSWHRDMDQVLLLLRNPRKAIPSYHTMRWELDYQNTWQACFHRIKDTYMERPSVRNWEKWRDRKAMWEIDNWFYFYDFWMQAGFMESHNITHFRCNTTNNEQYIDCQPKQVVDFDSLYSSAVTDDFQRIGEVLDSSRDVETIASQARACVIHNVFNRTGHQDLNMHQASRPNPELNLEYVFTIQQYNRLMNRTVLLRDKFSEEPLSNKPHADNLVNILNRYIDQNYPEFLYTADLYLEEYVNDRFNIRDADCSALEGDEVTICNFMKYKENHAIFFDGFYPVAFPFSYWLRVSTNIVQFMQR